ncbi:MAG: hypothetical protein ACOY94_02620 [Bacillota bacterium]
MSALSRVSYLLVSLILLAASVAATILLEWDVGGYIGTLSLLALLMIFWVAARRGPVTPADPQKKLRKSRGGGRPVVLHFFSDFHLGSLLRHVIDAKLEKTYRGRCEFIYISTFHPEADAMMENLKAELGDWVFFDFSGKMVGQAPRLTEEQMHRFLESTP